MSAKRETLTLLGANPVSDHNEADGQGRIMAIRSVRLVPMNHRRSSLPACVLLVDDDLVSLLGMSAALISEGFDVVSTSSGQSALEHVREGLRPAVLVTSTSTGTTDGIVLVDSVRRLSPSTEAVLVAHSAVSAGYLNAGEVAVVAKPLSMPRLVDLVSTLSGSRTAAAQDSSDYDAEPHGNRTATSQASRPVGLTSWILAALLIVAAWLLLDLISRRISPHVGLLPAETNLRSRYLSSGDQRRFKLADAFRLYVRCDAPRDSGVANFSGA
jgi:CheY-like chemotaxis protein